MKRFWKILVSLILVAVFSAVSFAATDYAPNKNHSGFLGKDGRAWYKTYSDYFYLNGGTAFQMLFTGTPTADRTITFQDGSGTVAFTTDVSTAAPAINAVTGAAADTTIAFTAYQGTFTSTLTNKDMFTVQGLGAFGDVSVMRIEQKTGNATDGTVLEVVSADANVDPLVVSSSAQAGVLTVGQAGTVSIIGATDITGNLGVTGDLSVTGSFYQAAIAAAAAGNTNLTIDAAGNGTITVGGVSSGSTIFPGGVSFTGNVDIGNAATDTLTITSIVDSDITLDDGTTDSPSLILKDATDQTVTLTKVDGGAATFTSSGATGGLKILVGNLWVGNGSPGVAAMNGEDFYVEGVSEFDSLVTMDAGLNVTGAAVNLNASSNFATNINTGSTNAALSLGGGSGTVAVNSTTWDVDTAGAFTGVTGFSFATGAAATLTLAADGAADDLTISVTGAQNSSLVLASAGTGADALDVKTTAGGMLFTASGAMADQFKVTAAGTIAGNAINLATTNGGIVLTAGNATNGDITITAGDAFAMNATGTAAITSSDWGISTTGAMTKIASVSYDSSTVVYHTSVACNNACIKGLRAAPLELVATPGAGYFIETVSAVLILNYGTNVLTESADNLVIEYGTSGQDITAAIEMTGFIDAAADQMAIIYPAAIPTVAAASLANNNIRLFNTGDGEFAGNAGNDTTLAIKVAYRVHPTGL